jgi:hypothetical protein
MPWSYAIEHDPSPVVVVRADGVSSRDEWVATLAAVNEDPRCADLDVMIDATAMANLPEPGRGPAILEDINAWLPERRVAFVARKDALYGMGRQIELLSDERLAAFRTVSDGLDWLDAPPARIRSQLR